MSSSKKRAAGAELASLREEEKELSRRLAESVRQVEKRRRTVAERETQVAERWTKVNELRGKAVQTAEIKEEIREIKEEIEKIEEGNEKIKEEIREIKEEMEKISLDRKEVAVKASQVGRGFGSLELSQDSYFKEVRAVGAPSNLSRVNNWRKPQESLLYLCHIPPEAEPPFPLTLAHPAFANFVDRVNSRRIEFGNEDCILVHQLCNLVVRDHKNENVRMQEFNGLLTDYLGQTISPVVVMQSYPTDGSLVSENHMVYHSEGKLHEGNSLFPAIHYYGLFLSTMRGRKTESTFCPCFLVELVGFHIRISGLAFFERVACQPFTPFLHCYFSSYDKTDMDSLCRAMLALKRGVSELLQYYSPHPTLPQAVDKNVPYSLCEEKVEYVKRIGTKLLFLVRMQPSGEHRLFKFCKRYGKAVHELWAAHGLAPKLFKCQSIAGGWFAVEMEYLDGWKSVHQWCNSEQDVEKCGLRQAIQNALERAHKLDGQLAHGDMRAPNIMAKSVGATFEIKFVDFDWAGEVSTTPYPSFINTEEKWHKDVGPGKPLYQDHDKWWEDKWIQGGTTT